MMIPSNVFMKLEFYVDQEYVQNGQSNFEVLTFSYYGLQNIQAGGSFIESDMAFSNDMPNDSTVTRHYMVYVLMDTQNAMLAQRCDDILFNPKASLEDTKWAYNTMFQIILEIGIRAYAEPLKQAGIVVNIPHTSVKVENNTMRVVLSYSQNGVDKTAEIDCGDAELAMFNVLVVDGVEGDLFSKICNAIGVTKPEITRMEDETMSLSDILDEADDEVDVPDDEKPSEK